MVIESGMDVDLQPIFIEVNEGTNFPLLTEFIGGIFVMGGVKGIPRWGLG